MKATIDVPDELYRRVKAKSALEGRPVREVAVDLFRSYVDGVAVTGSGMQPGETNAAESPGVREQPPPPWFGLARDYARNVKNHSVGAIRASIAKGRQRETAAKSSSPRRKPKR